MLLSNMDNIQAQLDDNKAEHKTIMEQLKDFSDKLTELMLKVEGLPSKILERADERYASKTTEKAVYGLIGAICLAVVYALVELIKQ
jgi:hypothetical protein